VSLRRSIVQARGTTLAFMLERMIRVLLLGLLTLVASAVAPPGKSSSGSSARGECIPSDTDHTNFYCWSGNDGPAATSEKKFNLVCEDAEDACPDWARSGECQNNPHYMLIHCAKSCDSCVSLHAGVTQVSPDLHDQSQHRKDEFIQKLVSTQEYVQDLVERNPAFFKTCKNFHELCTHWSLMGRCRSDRDAMVELCPASCRIC